MVWSGFRLTLEVMLVIHHYYHELSKQIHEDARSEPKIEKSTITALGPQNQNELTISTIAESQLDL